MRKTGVYRLRNLVNGKVYYGSTIDTDQREWQHFNALAAGKHCNRFLQASYKKHGRDAFVFEVVEECPEVDLLLREQVYLDSAALDRVNHYNLSFLAGKPLLFKDQTPEQQAKHRAGIAVRNRRMSADPAFAAAASKRRTTMNADPVFKAANAERLRRRNADPVFKAEHAKRTRERNADPVTAAAWVERTRKMNADPVFKAALIARLRSPSVAAARLERLRKLHSDPVFKEAHVERTRKRNADPAVAAAWKEDVRRRNADPAFAAARDERLRKMHVENEALKAPMVARILELNALGWTQERIGVDVGLTQSAVGYRLKKLHAKGVI